jgi:creatinine amidohydrolase/Fe(II)-dependent formamide hydrolase-like protein
MRTHQVELLRPSENIQALKEAPVAYLPAGSLESLGPHSILGADPLNAQNIAQQIGADGYSMDSSQAVKLERRL